jgi:hypothetical protein
MLLLALEQSKFLVAASVLNAVLNVTHGLSVQLQTVQTDLLKAISRLGAVARYNALRAVLRTNRE